jgi:hypothetical protein
MPPARCAADTARAAAELAEAGAECVVTYGGDGTNRAVAAGWPHVVIVALPGGTNNAFAQPADPTAAGLAAAHYADAPHAAADARRPAPRGLGPAGGRPDETALVDVALVSDEWVGAHAVWHPERLIEAVVVHADPTVPGLSGVAGMTRAGVPGQGAVHLRFGRPGHRLLAPLGPGQLTPVWVREARALRPGEVVTMRGPGTLALDGEREVVLRAGEPAHVRLVADGPWVLDVSAVLRARAREGPARIRTTERATTGGGS